MSFIARVCGGRQFRCPAVLVGWVPIALCLGGPADAQLSGAIQARARAVAAAQKLAVQAAESAKENVHSRQAGDDADTDASQTKSAEETRKQERLAAINELVFDRRPSAILKAWSTPHDPQHERDQLPQNPSDTDTSPTPDGAQPNAEQADDQQEKAKKEQQQFAKTTRTLTDSVTRGQWDQFAATLHNLELLSSDEASAVYHRMLDQLSADAPVDFSQVVGLSQDMQAFLQQMMGNRRNNPAVAYAEKHVIQIPDLVGIVRSLPPQTRVGHRSEKSEPAGDATASDPATPTLEQPQGRVNIDVLQKIAKLLRLCLDAGFPVEEFVGAMQPIADAVLPAQDIAVILSAAGQDAPTADFLPPIDEAVDADNAQALNLWAKHYLALYRDDKQESLRVEAWQCTLQALAMDQDQSPQDENSETAAANAERDEALTRAVALAPKLDDNLGKAWLQESFTKDPRRGQEVMAKLGTATAQRLAQTPQDAQGRGENLKLQHAAVDALLRTDTEIDSQWTGILNLLASNWLSEAQVTSVHSTHERYGLSMRRDRYGNLYYADPEPDQADQAQRMVMRETNPVDVETILDTAPQGEWFQLIDDPLKPGFTTMICRLWLKVNESEKAFPYIESLATTDPETARDLAEEFLRVWTKDHNPNQESSRTSHYMFMFGYDQKADNIPLTRSKQERNLKELSGWIERLNQLPLDGRLDESLLVEAFMTCHSVAEVYDVETIEQVFGAWDQLEPGTMAQLINQMRVNLASIWRDPNVQRDNKTNRKKQDIQTEVIRGYDVANSVLEKALQRHPGSWQLTLSQACLLHDQNAYLHEIAPSSNFSDRRQQAFAYFAAAADSYLAVVAELPEREQSGAVFDHWFYAALGASDLAGISEKNRPDAKQVGQLKAAMERLPGEVGRRHRENFANALFTRMSAVSPACKFRYLDAGFQLVDPDDPKAAEARKVYDYYRDLVTELVLVTRIDGDARVGHEQPFGVYVDLRHTKAIERESGGFSKYLQNQNSGYGYYYNYGRPTENYRDKFEESVAAALEEHFEVMSVTFSHSETKSLDAGDGWRVTPYAYLLLKARGPEVDKLPALKLDMDFLDTSGYVVLPIDSSPLPLDAGEMKVRAESYHDLKLVQLLDERQSTEGKLIVETRATAQGLVPSLDRLLDTSVAGFALVEQEDSGVSVIEFDKESTLPVILSERTWTLTYAAADPAAPTPTDFTFPAALVETSELQHQRYVDADLEDVASTVSLVQGYGSNRRRYLAAGVGALAALSLAVAAAITVRRLRRSKAVAAVVSEPPLTPVALWSRLRALRQRGKLDDRHERQLDRDIAAIELHYFAGTDGQAEPDLPSIAARWQQVT